MYMRPTTVLLIALAAALSALAQPTTEDTYLIVRAVTTSGEQFPAAPQVVVWRVDGDRRNLVPGGYIATPQQTSLVLALRPGPHELTLALPAYGVVGSRIPVDIAAGPNVYVWTLPPQATLRCVLTRDGAPVTPTTGLAEANSDSIHESREFAMSLGEGYGTIAGLFPGRYSLLLSTDAGYGTVRCTVTGTEPGPVDVSVALQPGMPLVGQVVDAASRAPIPEASVRLQLENKGNALQFVLTTDAAGRFAAPQVPPGTWSATVIARDDVVPGRYTIALDADAPQEVVIEMPTR
jgi:hypothetical protein